MAEEATVAARPNRRKIREGVVVSDAQDKTAVVATVDRVGIGATARRCSAPSGSMSTTRTTSCRSATGYGSRRPARFQS